MKRVIGAMVMGMALFGTACSDGRIQSIDDTAGGSFGEEPTSSQQGLNTIEVRMRAVGAEAFTKLMLVPNEVKAYAHFGQYQVEIPVRPTFHAVDLANMKHAEQLATFELPAGANKVTFKVDLGAAGGFDTATASGWVDTRNSVLRFDMSAAELDRMKRAVIIFDAKRTFIQRDAETMVLVPNFRVD